VGVAPTRLTALARIAPALAVGWAIGCRTSYPANAWLIRRRVKEAM